jgi:hypothetical protein
MAIVLLIWIAKSLSDPEVKFDRGSLFPLLGLYAVLLVLAELYGLATGGDLVTSLWELRSQVYMLVAYILACNLITTRRHVTVLLWILLLGTGVRAIEATIRYLTFIRGSAPSALSLFSHEEAFFLNAALTLAVVLAFYGGPRRMRVIAFALFPAVLLADFASQRRTAVLALAIGILAILLVTSAVRPRARRLCILILALLAVGFPPYYLAFQNSYSTLAEPVRAINSQIDPTPRDASSDLYRTNEDHDIMATVRTSAIVGYGLGKPMLTPYPLPGAGTVSQLYTFWNVLPHNSVLWVWMRLGSFGYFLFWILIGTAITQALGLMRRLRDPFLQGLALFIAVMIVQEVIFGYLDLQWTNPRNLILVGVLFALVSRLARFAGEGTEPPIEGPQPSIHSLRAAP